MFIVSQNKLIIELLFIEMQNSKLIFYCNLCWYNEVMYIVQMFQSSLIIKKKLLELISSMKKGEGIKIILQFPLSFTLKGVIFIMNFFFFRSNHTPKIFCQFHYSVGFWEQVKQLLRNISWKQNTMRKVLDVLLLSTIWQL